MLEVIDHGPVRELKLAHPPANALGRALLEALGAAVRQAPSAGARALVLSGAPGRFSGGMDVPALLAADRAGVHATWSAFFDVLKTLAASPLPLVAALTGHSPAGGTVLALFADYRILAEGPHVVGLNEVQVGLPVPPCLYDVLSFVVGRRHAARLATGGLLLSPSERSPWASSTKWCPCRRSWSARWLGRASSCVVPRRQWRRPAPWPAAPCTRRPLP